MKRITVLIGCILLTACGVPQDVPPEDLVVDDPLPPAIVPITEEEKEEPPLKLEQVPSELSVAYFGKMKLEGTKFERSFIIESNDAYTRHAIEYRSNGLRISGILNIPKGEGPFPLVLLNHGYIDPDVYTRGRGLKREQDYLARQGFSVLHSDYRGHGESDESPDTREIYDASLEYSMDIVNAIKAIRAANIPKIDTGNVGMLGHSMGGGVTLNILTAHPNLVDAAVLYAPVHSDAWENFLQWIDMRDEKDRTREVLGTRKENPAAWNMLSSLTLLKNIRTPITVFHGSNDDDVPKEWSDFLVNELQDLGKVVTYVEYVGEHHEFITRWEDFMAKTSSFFRAHLYDKTPELSLSIYDPSRVSKKPFGIFITPENSPISPEKFRGYHTGADYEVLSGEDETKIYVTALCAGEVTHRSYVNGYGGVLIQLCQIHSQTVTVLYGHLSLSSITPSVGSDLLKGDEIGTLGKGYSVETDGERPHLHLSVHKGSAPELKGYVGSEGELGEWMDPLTL